MPDGRRSDVERALIAGAFYFQIVFAIGFALGVLRTLVVAPAVGQLLAVLIELPLIIAASWIVARWLVVRFRVPASLDDRLMMGAFAFTLLMLIEAALATYGFGNSLAQHLAGYRTLPGLAGLAGQVLFAAIPALQLTRK